MQLYSSVITHYPAGGTSAAAAASPTSAAVFKVSLSPGPSAAEAPSAADAAGASAAAESPAKDSFVPAGGSSSSSAAAMPAFSSCLEVMPSGPAAGPAGRPAGGPQFSSCAQDQHRLVPG